MRLQKVGLCLTVLWLATTGSAAAATNYRAQVQVEGQLVVTFRGDPAAGCEAFARCDVEAGSIRWTPQTRGRLYVVEFGRHRRLFSSLDVFGFGEGNIGTLALLERRAADGSEQRCLDARGGSYETLPVTTTKERTVRFSLEPSRRGYPPQPPLPTHCGGPLQVDMLRGLPTREVSMRTLLRGPTKIDLSGSADFAVNGLAGTVSSTIEVHVGKMRARHLRVRRRPPRPTRIRAVQVEYRVTDVSGSVPVEVQSDPRTCGPLDACGLAGSLTVTPGPAEGEAYLVAYGRRPKLELRRAVGLARGPAPRKVRVYGYLELEKAQGSLVAALERDGTPACRDTLAVRRNLLDLRVRSGEVTAGLGGRNGYGADFLATRCPGPLGSDLGGRGYLASGSVPLSAFGGKHVTLHLTHGASRTTPGFRLRSRPDVTIELEREND